MCLNLYLIFIAVPNQMKRNKTQIATWFQEDDSFYQPATEQDNDDQKDDEKEEKVGQDQVLWVPPTWTWSAITWDWYRSRSPWLLVSRPAYSNGILLKFPHCLFVCWQLCAVLFKWPHCVVVNQHHCKFSRDLGNSHISSEQMWWELLILKTKRKCLKLAPISMCYKTFNILEGGGV